MAASKQNILTTMNLEWRRNSSHPMRVYRSMSLRKHATFFGRNANNPFFYEHVETHLGDPESNIRKGAHDIQIQRQSRSREQLPCRGGESWAGAGHGGCRDCFGEIRSVCAVSDPIVGDLTLVQCLVSICLLFNLLIDARKRVVLFLMTSIFCPSPSLLHVDSKFNSINSPRSRGLVALRPQACATFLAQQDSGSLKIWKFKILKY